MFGIEVISGLPPARKLFASWLFRRSGLRVQGSDSEAGKGVLSKEANGRDSVEGNGYPRTAQRRKLHSDMNVLKPKGGTLGGYSFNSAYTESARIYPNLPA